MVRKFNEKTSLSWLHGRIAESIVERMFADLGYRVQRYGIEHSSPMFVENAYQLNGPVATQIRNSPDFVVQRNKGLWFVEVKYRSNGSLDIKEIEKHGAYPYPETLFVLVTPSGIKAQFFKDLKAGTGLVPIGNVEKVHTANDIVAFYNEKCGLLFRS